MQVSKDSTIVLIENPLTGNDSFARALRLSRVSEDDKWSTPSRVRKVWTRWDEAKKIVLVRDPKERFESGASLAYLLLTEDLHDESDAPEFWLHLTESYLFEKTANQRAFDVLSFLSNNPVESWPVFLRPQRLWLSAKFDIVLATHNIAEFFNVEGKVSCIRSNQFASKNTPNRVRIGDSKTNALFNEVYRDDIDFLNRVRLWSPNPEKIRLISGYCAECARKQNAKAIEIIDLVGDSHTSANEESAPVEAVEPESITTEEVVASSRRRERKRVDKDETEG